MKSAKEPVRYRIYFLNELTLLPFIVSCFFSRGPLAVFSVRAYFLPFKRPLDSLLARLKKRFSIAGLFDVCPEISHIQTAGSEIYLYNIFEKIERWQNIQFDFDKAGRFFPDFPMAYKSAVCNYLRQFYPQILALSFIRRRLKDGEADMRWTDPLISAAARAFDDPEHPENALTRKSLPRRVFYRVANACIMVLCWGYTIIWIARKTRLSPPAPETNGICINRVSYAFGDSVCKELGDLANKVTYIRRPQDPPMEKFPEPFKVLKAGEGAFSMPAAFDAATEMTVESVRLFARNGDQEPDLYYLLSKLPFIRTCFKGLFNIVRPKVFIGADEDDADHIVRRHELNKIGAKSIGFLHAMSSYSNLRSTFRYVSFDYLLSYGPAVEKYYLDSWSKDMTVLPSGTRSAPGADVDDIDAPGENDIAVFAAIYTFRPEFISFIRELAGLFPDRKIWLQLKGNYRKSARGPGFIEACTKDLPNVHPTTDSIFAIMKRSQYLFSDPSTVMVEALEFNKIVFFTNVVEMHESCIYRDFDGLCVSSASDAAKKIQDIEQGNTVYRREDFSQLVDLSGRTFFEILGEQTTHALSE